MATVMLATLATTDAVERRSLRPFVPLAAVGGACAFARRRAARLCRRSSSRVDHPRRQWETDADHAWQIVRNGYWWKGIEPVPRQALLVPRVRLAAGRI